MTTDIEDTMTHSTDFIRACLPTGTASSGLAFPPRLVTDQKAPRLQTSNNNVE